MKAITKYLKLYRLFWRVAFNTSLMYRFDTVMLFVGVVFWVATNLIFFGSVFNAVGTINGWNFKEYLFLAGIFQASWSFYKLFYGRIMEECIEKVFNGQYDYFLLKPINERFIGYLLPPLFKSLPNLISGAAMFIYSLFIIDVSINPMKLFILAFYCVLGQIILFSFSQIAFTTSFFSGQSSEIFGILEDAWSYGRYPKEIFSGASLFFLTYVIPIAFFASVPASYFLGKNDLTVINLVIPLLVTILFAYLSNAFYKYGIRNYTSASS